MVVAVGFEARQSELPRGHAWMFGVDGLQTGLRKGQVAGANEFSVSTHEENAVPPTGKCGRT